MSNEKNLASMQVLQPAPGLALGGAASARRRLPTIAKCIVIVPLTMALLGAEIELRLGPKLDVLLTTAGVWVIWAWLNS